MPAIKIRNHARRLQGGYDTEKPRWYSGMGRQFMTYFVGTYEWWRFHVEYGPTPDYRFIPLFDKELPYASRHNSLLGGDDLASPG